MVRSLRTMPTRRLLATCGVVLAAGGSVTAIALAAQGSGDVPADKTLAAAIHDALAAPAVQGVTARIEFTNKLIDTSAFHGGSPLLSGATGRLWAGTGDRFRLELQSENGDAQIVSDGRFLTLYDATSNSGYRLRLPGHRGRRAERHAVPSIARIQKALNRLARHLTISGAVPSNVAGQPAYTVRVAPTRDGGLLSRLELAWDAARGVPLRAAVYAVGNADPVLELAATGIDYGPVADSTFAISAPDGADITTIKRGRDRADKTGRGHRGKRRHVRGVKRVAARLPFTLSAPKTLAGMTRSGVHLLDFGGRPAALVTYGRGLGGLAVIERSAAEEKARRQRGRANGRDGFEPTLIDVNGTQAIVLPTALGTAVTFTRDGVRYAVIGSVRQPVAEAAARGL
jgi:outer membrane lipoprotein-sorting protein